MTEKKQADILHLLHSDELIVENLKETNAFFAQHLDIAHQVMERNQIIDSLSKLAPVTPDKVDLEHTFPLREAEYESEISTVLCKIGFYKNAIISLRNILELGLLSIYWDINDNEEVDIQEWLDTERTKQKDMQDWLRSTEKTPFRKEVFKKLTENENIKVFNEKKDIFTKTDNLYSELSGFLHTQGVKHSRLRLNLRNSNIGRFDAVSLKKWIQMFCDVIEMVTIFHVLRYPIALQYTPLDDKFGINPPAGGFLRPFEVDKIKRIISNVYLSELQDMSDNDEKAVAMAEWVNKRPDITEEDLTRQFEESDKQEIQHFGYNNWLKNERHILKLAKQDKSKEYHWQLKRIDRMTKWAKENGFFEPSEKRVDTSQHPTNSNT